VAGGRVFAASVGGTLHALDAGSGKALWTASLGSEDVQRWDTCAPKCVDGVVYAGRGGHFAALDAAHGEEIWKAKVAMDQNWWPNLYASPAIGRHRIYLGSGKGIFALDRETGEVLWHEKARSASPVLGEDGLYALMGDFLATLDPENGEILQQAQVFYGDETGCPALFEGEDARVYVGCADGRMVAVDPGSGLQVGAFSVERGLASLRPYQRDERTISSSPAVSGGHLIFGGNDGHLYVLDRAGLALKQKIYIGAPIPGSPAVSGNTVFIAAYDGNVYAFSSAP
jgi:outer membrane protein assembly factor BamB